MLLKKANTRRKISNEEMKEASGGYYNGGGTSGGPAGPGPGQSYNDYLSAEFGGQYAND